MSPNDLAHSYKITSFNAILIKEIIPTLKKKKKKAALLYRSKFNICLRQTVMSHCNLGFRVGVAGGGVSFAVRMWMRRCERDV